MMVSVITPSFNKKKYVRDAIESVLNQTYPDFEYVIVENSTDAETRESVKKISMLDERIRYIERDFTDEERKSKYITAYINNAYYPTLQGKYILYLSDDDLLYPNCLENMVMYLEGYKGKAMVAYHSQAISREKEDGSWEYISPMMAIVPRGFGTDNPQVNCMLDGGQIMHRADCLMILDSPYFPEDMDNASSCDGKFMEKLAKHFTFYPMGQQLLSEHRRTNSSTWVKPYD